MTLAAIGFVLLLIAAATWWIVAADRIVRRDGLPLANPSEFGVALHRVMLGVMLGLALVLAVGLALGLI